MPPFLPPELLLPIVEAAAGPPDDLDYTTLRHLCLTSRDFLPFARAELYRHLEFDYVDAENADDADYNGDEFQLEILTFRWDGDLVASVLRNAPNLARLVTGFSLTFSNTNELSVLLPRIFIRDILESCSNIRHCCLDGNIDTFELGPLLDELAFQAPSLNELNVAAVDFQQLQKILGSFTQLRKLTFEGFSDHLTSPPPGVALNASLESFIAPADLADTAIALVGVVLASSVATLRHVELPATALLAAIDLLPYYGALAHLSLELEDPHRFGALSGALLMLGHLQILAMANVSPWDTSAAAIFVLSLPSRLVAIRLEGLFAREPVEAILGDSSRPALRQLVWDREYEERPLAKNAGLGWTLHRFGSTMKWVR